MDGKIKVIEYKQSKNKYNLSMETLWVGEYVLDTGHSTKNAIPGLLERHNITLTKQQFRRAVKRYAKAYSYVVPLFDSLTVLNSLGLSIADEDYKLISSTEDISEKLQIVQQLIQKYVTIQWEKIKTVCEHRFNTGESADEVSKNLSNKGLKVASTSVERYVKSYLEKNPQLIKLEALIVQINDLKIPYSKEEYSKKLLIPNEAERIAALEKILVDARVAYEKNIIAMGDYRLETGATYEELAIRFGEKDSPLSERTICRYMEVYEFLFPEKKAELDKISKLHGVENLGDYAKKSR